MRSMVGDIMEMRKSSSGEPRVDLLQSLIEQKNKRDGEWNNY